MTATPGTQGTPPTTGAATDGSGDGTTPIFAMLIGLAFAALAAFAAANQRRTLRR